MIHAYDKIYLDKARVALGRMLDFAVFDLKYDISEFFDLFIRSGVADRFERGDCTLTVGMSGVELAYEVLERFGVRQERVRPNYTVDRSEEFWTGWSLAYYQWETSLRFAEISGGAGTVSAFSRDGYSPVCGQNECDVSYSKTGNQPQTSAAEGGTEPAWTCGVVACSVSHHTAVRAAAEKYQQSPGGVPCDVGPDVVLRYGRFVRKYAVSCRFAGRRRNAVLGQPRDAGAKGEGQKKFQITLTT